MVNYREFSIFSLIQTIENETKCDFYETLKMPSINLPDHSNIEYLFRFIFILFQKGSGLETWLTT